VGSKEKWNGGVVVDINASTWAWERCSGDKTSQLPPSRTVATTNRVRLIICCVYDRVGRSVDCAFCPTLPEDHLLVDVRLETSNKFFKSRLDPTFI
jgi:hypothetical protein